MSEVYDINIGRFIREHPDHVVAAGFEGVGYRARRRDGGPWHAALTLDELDEQLRMFAAAAKALEQETTS